MSTIVKKAQEKITIPKLQKMRDLKEKITMVTAYDFTQAKILEEAGIEMVLVGDSLGMVVQGHESTLPVSIDEMVYHTQCVARGLKLAHLISDMPFMSYQVSHEDAVHNAGRLIKAGATSIKIEGGEEMTDLIWYLNKIGIPVMGHIGLKPQSINVMGGYKIQGKTKKDADLIVRDAELLEEAGAYALLLEGIPLEVAKRITEEVDIPTIGIGSGPHCSGQVLVFYDLIGADPRFTPRFVKKYANFHEMATTACKEYLKEVKKGMFPAEKHSVHRNLVEVKTVK